MSCVCYFTCWVSVVVLPYLLIIYLFFVWLGNLQDLSSPTRAPVVNALSPNHWTQGVPFFPFKKN